MGGSLFDSIVCGVWVFVCVTVVCVSCVVRRSPQFACSVSLSLRAKLSNSCRWRCRLGLVSVVTYVSPLSSTVSSVCVSVA